MKLRKGEQLPLIDVIFRRVDLDILEYPGLSESEAGGSRFILDHDTGGAIRGPGRVDLYWGVGDRAEEVSGRMKGEGRLYYFVPRRLVSGVSSGT